MICWTCIYVIIICAIIIYVIINLYCTVFTMLQHSFICFRTLAGLHLSLRVACLIRSYRLVYMRDCMSCLVRTLSVLQFRRSSLPGTVVVSELLRALRFQLYVLYHIFLSVFLARQQLTLSFFHFSTICFPRFSAFHMTSLLIRLCST